MLIIRCDRCGKEEPFYDDHPVPPDGWVEYRVETRKYFDGGCSKSTEANRLYSCDQCSVMTTLEQVTEAIEQCLQQELKK